MKWQPITETEADTIDRCRAELYECLEEQGVAHILS